MAETACLVTGSERAAIATIVLRGEAASEIIATNFTANSKRKIVPGDVRYGIWHGPHGMTSGMAGESVVVVAIDHEFDPQASWEVHCHGGEIAAKRILDDMSVSGVTVVNQRTWLGMTCPDALEREAIEVLTRTLTTRTAAIVIDQVRGAMRNFATESWDAVGSESHVGTSDQDAIDAIRERAEQILEFADFGRHLNQSWKVVLAGVPNVGKSSLINALVGYRRSITLDQPGTTRDVLQANAVIDGWPIMLSDTAGIRHQPAEDIERQGIERALKTVQEADLVVWVSDSPETKQPDLLAAAELPIRSIHVLNKIDLMDAVAGAADSEVIRVSATKQIGIDTLQAAIVNNLVPILPDPGSPVPITQRQVDALNCIVAATRISTLRAALNQLLGKAD